MYVPGEGIFHYRRVSRVHSEIFHQGNSYSTLSACMT